MKKITIEQLERAINIWRARSGNAVGCDDSLTLCAQARALADVYGLMIFNRTVEVNIDSLSIAQADAIRRALNVEI